MRGDVDDLCGVFEEVGLSRVGAVTRIVMLELADVFDLLKGIVVGCTRS